MIEQSRTSTLNESCSPVVYEDKVGKLEQKRLLESTNIPFKKQKTELDETLFHHIPYFVLSGIPLAEKEYLVNAIQKLGGMVSNTDKWDRNSTHLIITKPQKTEKFLCACAAGAW
jgi:hypothetical protein